MNMRTVFRPALFHLYTQTRSPDRIAILASGSDGWDSGMAGMARDLAKDGTWILGVDFRIYSRQMETAPGACAYSASDFDALSHFAQKKLGLKEYREPILIGRASGAALVYGVLAQAPQGIFVGAISMGFCPELDIDKPLCDGEGLRSRQLPHGRNGFGLLPATHLQAPWIALQGLRSETCGPEGIRKFVAQVPKALLVKLPKMRDGVSDPKHGMPELRTALANLAVARKKPSPFC
jgi:type IV secretory pathway VirJ component